MGLVQVTRAIPREEVAGGIPPCPLIDHDLVQDIAKAVVKAVVEDGAYIPYLPQLRLRFGATSEEVLAGVGLAHRWLLAYERNG